MIRISYKIEGMLNEEIINPYLTPITEEMLSNLDKIYLFKKGKTIGGRTARAYARKLVKDCFYNNEH